jgi:hypothetical protein
MLLAKLDAYNEGVHDMAEDEAMQAALGQTLAGMRGPNGEKLSRDDLIV